MIVNRQLNNIVPPARVDDSADRFLHVRDDTERRLLFYFISGVPEQNLNSSI
jgi:hypothetical protein